MNRHVGRYRAAKIAGETIGFVVGQLGLNVIKPITADKPVHGDLPLMHMFTRDFGGGQAGRMVLPIGGMDWRCGSGFGHGHFTDLSAGPQTQCGQAVAFPFDNAKADIMKTKFLAGAGDCAAFIQHKAGQC